MVEVGDVPEPRARIDPRNQAEPALAPINLREAARVLRRHPWIVLGLTGVALGVATFLALRAEPIYRATAVIRLADARRSLTGNLVENPTGPTGRSVDLLLSQLEVLRSRTIAGTVVDSMGILRVRVRDIPTSLLGGFRLTPDAPGDSLRLLFSAGGFIVSGRAGEVQASYGAHVEMDGVGFTVARQPELPRATIVLVSRDAAVDALLAHLQIRLRDKTDVVDVTYSAADPERAQEVVNRVVEVFRLANAAAARQESQRRREFIESRLQFNDSLLAAARQSLSSFRSSRRYDAGTNGGREVGKASDLAQRRRELATERQTYRKLLAELNSPKPSGASLPALMSMPEVAANAQVRQLYDQLVQYERARDSLTTGQWARSPTHPDVQRLSTLIAGIQRRLLETGRDVVQRAESGLAGRIALIDSLGALDDVAFRRLTATEGEEARLEGQVETIRRLTDQLREEYQKARIAEAVEVGQVEIVDLAALPGAADGVPLARRLLFGLLLGLLLGGGGAVLADHLGTAIRRPDQIEHLGLQVLGVIPHFNGRAAAGESEQAVPIVEAMRGLRLNLAHAYGAAGPLVVAVTSAGSREGKSFIVANLAMAFAHAGQRTLLIDGDLRRGVLHRVLNGARKPGLTDCLAGDVPAADVVQRTTIDSLFFIGSGARRPDAPELLVSPAMKQLVTTLSGDFGTIVVDTPPLAAGVDAFAIGVAVGHMIIVLRLGTTDSDVTKAKLDVLERLPVRLLGTVLNDARQAEGYEKYYYHMEGYELRDERAHGRVLIRNR